jgi:hypothetical protein
LLSYQSAVNIIFGVQGASPAKQAKLLRPVF